MMSGVKAGGGASRRGLRHVTGLRHPSFSSSGMISEENSSDSEETTEMITLQAWFLS